MPRVKEGFKGERLIVFPDSFIEEIRQDILGRELYITDIGYFPRAGYHYRERSSEECSEYILIYCVEGEGWFEIYNHRYPVTANHFFIIPEHTAHAYGSNSTNPWSIYWIHFNGAKAAFFSRDFKIPFCIHPQQDSRIKERLNLFEEIYASLSYGFNKNYMLYAITCLFHFLGSMKFIGEYRSSNSMMNPKKDTIQIAIHYMKENISNHILLSDLAGEVKLSVSYFSKVFEKETGYPPLKYVAYLRIQEACRYLSYTQLKINQITPLIGFQDPLYFSRLFNKVMGMSPSAFREKGKG